MYISVTEAQRQLLDLVRRAQAGEEVVLTHDGHKVVALQPLRISPKPWTEMTPAERLRVIQAVVAQAPPKPAHWPDAAHSQDFLYDDDGLPA